MGENNEDTHSEHYGDILTIQKNKMNVIDNTDDNDSNVNAWLKGQWKITIWQLCLCLCVHQCMNVLVSAECILPRSQGQRRWAQRRWKPADHKCLRPSVEKTAPPPSLNSFSLAALQSPASSPTPPGSWSYPLGSPQSKGMTSHLTIYSVYFEFRHNVVVIRRQHIQLSDTAESLATINVYILRRGHQMF